MRGSKGGGLDPPSLPIWFQFASFRFLPRSANKPWITRAGIFFSFFSLFSRIHQLAVRAHAARCDSRKGWKNGIRSRERERGYVYENIKSVGCKDCELRGFCSFASFSSTLVHGGKIHGLNGLVYYFLYLREGPKSQPLSPPSASLSNGFRWWTSIRGLLDRRGGMLHYYVRNKLGQRSVLITWNLVSLPFDGRLEVREVDIG